MPGKSFQFAVKVVHMNRQNESNVYNFIINSSSVKKANFHLCVFLISSVYVSYITEIVPMRYPNIAIISLRYP